MTYGKVFKRRTCETYQYSNEIDPTTPFNSKDCQCVSDQVWDLSSPGLPLYPSRYTGQKTHSDPGGKSALYRKVAAKPDQKNPSSCRRFRADIERRCQSGAKCFSQETGTWLTNARRRIRYSWNTALTDYLGANYLKSINNWCRRRGGQEVRKNQTLTRSYRRR